MSSGFQRLGRFCAWSLVTLLVLLAIVVTSLRIALPHLNQFQDEIKTWVKHGTGFDFSISSVAGAWRNSHPSVALIGLEANLPDNNDARFAVDEIHIEFDLLQSLWQFKPVVADLSIRNLALDIRTVDLLPQAEVRPQATSEPSEIKLIDQLDSLFLRQFEDFTIADSKIWYKSISGEERRLDIDQLRWSNQGRRHFAEGTVSIADAKLNSLQVSANFFDHGSLRDVSGEFYISALDVSVTPWLTHYIQTESGIESGKVSLNVWLTLSHSQPSDAYAELQPSELVWSEDGRHELLVESGRVKLSPDSNGWKVSGHSFQIRTDDMPWPELDVAFDWQPEGWVLNLSQVDIEALLPLVKLMPDSASLSQQLQQLAPKGEVEDIRISMQDGWESLRYSAELERLGLTQWDLLPGFHQVHGRLSGDLYQAQASINVIDDVFPYGDVFQAPLNIKQGEVEINWQRDEQGWRLWSDKVTAATPDLQVLGAFRLDFPIQQSPFLSFYAEADLYNAGETWRYLPTLALGQELTDYLSAAIQGGKANTAKLLWYGELGDFPYHQHNGMFQAWVGLKEGKFSFDTAWPPITDLQLDLLFENDAMYLDSRSATLKGVTSKQITGRIPSLAPDGHIEIEAKASAPGNEVRDYMMATPLVDSVGAALTALQVSGPVSSEFQLSIPFDLDQEARAWGFADLKANPVEIDAPPMKLEKATGRIYFDNDVVTTSGLAAELLGQPISVDFRGESAEQGYNVVINTIGDWEVEPLKPYLGERWLSLVSGYAPWQMDIDLQLNDIGFTYQIDVLAQLAPLVSDYPYPLAKPAGEVAQAKLQASGDQQSVSARLQLPHAKYQTEIDISGSVPLLTASNLVLGEGEFKVSPVVGHQANVKLDKLNLDRWSALMQLPESEAPSVLSDMTTPKIPLPTQINADVNSLTLGGIEFNDVDFHARKKNLSWQLDVNSQEMKGKANYLQPYELAVSLERLHLYIPGLDELAQTRGSLFANDDQQMPLISDFDRQLHTAMPNLTLNIDDFWLQGYKVGQVNVGVQRREQRLELNQATIRSGKNRVDLTGWWELDEHRSHSSLVTKIISDNNTELMERFGITSGIQQAPFELSSNMEWEGAPWAMQTKTLQGDVSTEFGKGVISEVSGAARLLGLFSLDSIIRKMQLDFTDVFDKGMAFNSITGTGRFQDGVFVTNDIVMDALAGEMKIRGMADINTKMVDAEVQFTPDVTSGIPMLTAFAVAPQTALYVLAISTVISPVVEVFTQVNYEVKGSLDSPTVKEISRSKGEYKLPEKLLEQAK
ncbi:YhdP family protein [Vibrio sp. CAU 1672]|uniref:YhdP family protein n=1 Tax=Vibrio sp. CAU 1672 TaxID=3032594 RepID=UPI0023D98F14|nr:YhdP family protein [Vibrio sp. CAU 1672]MDF2155641.1 YhdP family protein [Vibrio sp. CAU 1672]